MWISPACNHELADWKALALQVASRPTHLSEIIHREPTHMGFCDTDGLGVGGAWLGPSGTGHNLVWSYPWPADVTSESLSLTNPHGTIADSDLELASLVLQEATLRAAVPKAYMAVPCSGSYNTPTISCSTREASMINPVVAELICIHALHSRKMFL